MTLSKGFLLATILLLGACASDDRAEPETTQPLPETQAPVQQQAAVPTKPERSFPPPAILDGLDAARVLDLLGTAPFKRRDDPALIWQYRTSLCALDLFLYREKTGGIYRVRHFETRNRGKAIVSTKDCFAALIIANEKASSG